VIWPGGLLELSKTVLCPSGSPSQSVEYGGCNDGYPVVWCEYPGGHTQPSIGPDATWTFFERF
jgi:hypothetical protein